MTLTIIIALGVLVDLLAHPLLFVTNVFNLHFRIYHKKTKTETVKTNKVQVMLVRHKNLLIF